MARRTDKFANVTTEGGMLPVDLLSRIYAIDSGLPGVSASDYHLASGDKLTDAISRSWSSLRSRWESFKVERDKFGDEERGTSATRERWLLPLFSELGYGRLMVAKAEEIEGRVYPSSHGWHRSPIHLVSASISLDEKRAGVAGASRSSPHSLVQEHLNRSSEKLWGFVSNGLTLRILRDNVSLTRQSYVEFDLEGIFDSEAFADFSLLWLLCHQSRVEAEKPEECWLEQWSSLAQKAGTRALDQLRSGVERAISALGNGVISERRNHSLREKLRSGELSKAELYRELLRIIYRLIFLFVAEDRGLLLLPDADPKARERYQRFYSTARLREMAAKVRGGHHIDQYQVLKLLFSSLGSSAGAPELAIGSLGSFLWSPQATPHLDSCELSNAALLDSVRALTTIVDGSSRRFVDYKNLGSEELGSIYESLLELHPELDIEAGAFELRTAQGNERKTTGSYYTPSSLINCLLDSALEPVVAEALKLDRSEKSILKLKVCDPACGSGHFLIGAAHRLAKHLARVRTGEDEPPPQAIRRAMRDVVGHCIYGVDINPMAVELCKVSLWLDALEPGRPLSFLEHRIQCGNSLLGVTPALLEKGIPDEAFEPIEGDEKSVCSALKRSNKKEREARAGGEPTWFSFEGFEAWDRLGNIQAFITSLDDIDDSSIEGIQKKQALYEEQVKGKSYLFNSFWADAWCAAFVWPKNSKQEEFLTEEVFRRIERNPHTVSPALQDEVKRIATKYSFFHWHLAFPGVFRVPKRGEEPTNGECGWSGGFDVVLGNPPWEKINLKDEEFFAARYPNIADASNKADRKVLIEALREQDPMTFALYSEAKRDSGFFSNFFRFSGHYPLTGVSRVNLYSIFGELITQIVGSAGRAGVILASGIATDANNGPFFSSLVKEGLLAAVYDFENRKGIFIDVHSGFKFALLVLRGQALAGGTPTCAFFLHSVEDILDANRCFSITYDDLVKLNPDSLNCPTFRTQQEALLATRLYQVGRSFALIEKTDGWPGSPKTPFNMSNDARLFKSAISPQLMLGESGVEWIDASEGGVLPLYESKMIHQYNHRYGTFEAGCDPEGEIRSLNYNELQYSSRFSLSRYWMDSLVAKKRYSSSWWLVYRMITCATNERTAIAAIIPGYPCGNSLSLISGISARNALLLCGNINSLVYDYLARSKIGGMNFNHYIFDQLPVIPLDRYSVLDGGNDNTGGRQWIESRVLELTYTSDDLRPFVADLGEVLTPYRYDVERREILKSELDAAFFHLYGLGISEVDYVLDQFPGLRSNEEREFGQYVTKRRVLEAFSRMTAVS